LVRGRVAGMGPAGVRRLWAPGSAAADPDPARPQPSGARGGHPADRRPPPGVRVPHRPSLGPESAGAVMADPPAPVLAHQLIYTNVEADLSPARQRGFQVWLCSPELTPDQRRHTAKRLDDFRLPPGSSPQDPGLARHVFFRLPDNGLFVIARTVPSAERDKFGRGGKFPAHAVLLNEDAFRVLGCDPFRVTHGRVRFRSSPAQAL